MLFYFKKYLIVIMLTSILSILTIILFYPIFNSTSIIFPYSLTPFDLCIEYPIFWFYFKKVYLSTCFIAYFIYIRFIVSILYIPKKAPSVKNTISSSTSIQLLVGSIDNTSENIYLNEYSLFQNILITGTIGTGKTSSAMYPFSRQLISYAHNDLAQKLGFLILDVKGNYYREIKKYAQQCNREDDLIIISLNSNVRYNPLDKPYLKPIVLANRLKTILELFSENNSDSYWLDKVEAVLTECIKFCRLYYDGYVTFEEIHKLVTFPNYYLEKIPILRNLFQSNQFSSSDVYDLYSCLNFFEKEFFNLDTRTLSIIKSEITRITNLFVSDYTVLKTFCPTKSNITFSGFEDVIKEGKIVVLAMNISEYRNLSKVIAAYLKLDFQTEVLNRISSNFYQTSRMVCFISDEFHEYVTKSDADFFAQSREARCINIVATQSYSSILNALHNEHATQVIIQNLVNKFWFRSDDIYTIEMIQKQIGKQDKEKISTTISENAKTTDFHYITNTLASKDTNISESINTYFQYDYIFDTSFFTQSLETFSCLSFLSTGKSILKPAKLKMLPYFKI